MKIETQIQEDHQAKLTVEVEAELSRAVRAERLGVRGARNRAAAPRPARARHDSRVRPLDLDREAVGRRERYGLTKFGQSCLLARRLVESGVRFVQVYHRGWDVHGLLPDVLPSQCKEIDQACWALVKVSGVVMEIVPRPLEASMFMHSRKSSYEEKEPCPTTTACSFMYSIGKAKHMIFE